MRSLLLTALITGLCLAPNLTHAQTASPGGAARGGSGGGGSRGGAFGATTFRQNAPARQVGRRAPNPARPIVPLAPPSAPPIGPFASPSALDRDIFRARPRTFAPRFNRSEGFFFGGGGYVTDPFGYISEPDSSAPVLDRYMRQGDSAEGYLRLDVEPESAQVYVDGFYAGTVADFRRGGGRALDAGPHRVEFRADGHDSQSVELRVRANDVLSYRGTLNPVDDRPQQRVVSAQPKTFYVIPRCYAGTSKPTAEQLPAGCRLSDLREVPPVVAPAQPARK